MQSYDNNKIMDYSFQTRRLEASIDPVASIILIFVCIVCAGFASGLTQGLLSLDAMEMTIKARSGTDEEKIYASKVLLIIIYIIAHYIISSGYSIDFKASFIISYPHALECLSN